MRPCLSRQSSNRSPKRACRQLFSGVCLRSEFQALTSCQFARGFKLFRRVLKAILCCCSCDVPVPVGLGLCGTCRPLCSVYRAGLRHEASDLGLTCVWLCGVCTSSRRACGDVGTSLRRTSLRRGERGSSLRCCGTCGGGLDGENVRVEASRRACREAVERK